MRKRLFVIPACAALCLALSGCAGIHGFGPQITGIKSFRFSYQVGNYMNGSVAYELKQEEDGSYTATVKPNQVAEEDAKKYKAGKDFADELAAFLRDKKVNRWNGFQKSDRHVLDGNGFSFSLWTTEDKNISASGYMRWPRGYDEVKAGIEAIFAKLEK
ncbi:MAG: hypothetical protein IJL47_00295 [Lachnospiraceae bacterium]|nr:hypothetical protein [Lachnospiraceae bacterium]